MNIKIFALAVLLSVVAVSTAVAQGLSGRGNTEQVTDKGCEAQVALVTKNVTRVRKLVEEILNCGAQYKLYDRTTGDCRDPEYPGYNFSEDGNQLIVKFEGPAKGEYNQGGYNVRGAKGPKGYDAAPGQCAPGYVGSQL